MLNLGWRIFAPVSRQSHLGTSPGPGQGLPTQYLLARALSGIPPTGVAGVLRRSHVVCGLGGTRTRDRGIMS